MEWGCNVRKMREWIEVARWERWENSEAARSERWELVGGSVVSRECGMEFKDKIMLYCSREVKDKQGFTAGIL